MSICMAKPRVTYTVDEKYKRAFESHAATVGKTFTELFHEMVREYCSDALERVEMAIKIEKSLRQSDKRKEKPD